MKQSKLYIQTLKEVPKDAEVKSHKLLVKGGYIKQLARGLYTYLPLGIKILNKIEKIVEEELDKEYLNKIHMPVLQPEDLWQKTDRWDSYGKEMMRLKDRHDRSFCLGPTHEEVITSVISNDLKSYKKLPVNLYQIQTKFRDELRPRYGLMRAREFLMMDAYSFTKSLEELDEEYIKMSRVYTNIFNRLGIKFKKIKASNGAIGGDASHEFMALSDIGEDTIYYCEKCDYAVNEEVLEENQTTCPDCGSELSSQKGIEIGHIFKLGSKYSEGLNANFLDQQGKSKPILMGCYGIGISRLLMSLVEQSKFEDKILWPESVTPFNVHILVANAKNEEQLEIGTKLYEKSINEFKTLLDDRLDRLGSKFKDSELIGARFVIVIGKDIKENLVELKDQLKEETIKVDLDEVLKTIKNNL